MKILELRFKNLNSLYGDWEIKFTAPQYVANGIFALTGPTGAGKSTILDAICLALYGETPRLGKITKSSNELMSRHTGECYAELLFASQAGRFLCRWEQRRARKRAAGELQNPHHEIAEKIYRGKERGKDKWEGRVLANQVRRVQDLVEEKTGMNFDRFTRSILLAQGRFDTFLKANAEQKSTILEQITGTEIYSKISQCTHERRRDEQEKLKALNAGISDLGVLQPEQEKEILENLATKQQQELDLAGKASETSRAITWLTAIKELQKGLHSLMDEAAKLQVATAAFKPERAKLARAVQAAALGGQFATLAAIRKQQSDDWAALQTGEAALLDLQIVAKNQAEALESAEQLTLNTKKEFKMAAPLLKQIRSLEQEIAARAKVVAESAKICAKEMAEIEAKKQTRAQELAKRAAAEKLLQTAGQYLREHARDEWLIGGLAGIDEQSGNLLAKQQEITRQEIACQNAVASVAEVSQILDAATKKYAGHKLALDVATKNLQQSKDALNKLLGDAELQKYRDEKNALLVDMASFKRIEELTEHRAKLKDGEPCSLCGATEHPFAAGNVPVPDETEQKIEELSKLIAQAEKMEDDNKKLAQAENALHKNLYDSEKLQMAAANDKKAAEKQLTEATDNLEKLRQNFSELEQAVLKKLQPLGIAKIPATGGAVLLESLRSRLKKWQEWTGKKNEIEKQLSAIDSGLQSLDAVIENQAKSLTAGQENLARLQKEQKAQTDVRKQLYGDKKPDDEEDRLNKAIVAAEAAEKNARSENSQQQQQLTTAKTHVASLNKRLVQRTPELKKTETNFRAALSPAGFAEEKLFLVAILPHEERGFLSARAKELDDLATELKAKQKDREASLAVEIAKKLSDKTLAELEPQCKKDEESLQELRSAIAGYKHKLQEHTSAEARKKEKKFAIAAQEKEIERWEKLHYLIGSADGKKYRNFAQGLTFASMVGHANCQLQKMTDRYLLRRDEQQTLELNVADNYQGGEIRSTKNLSGGESFIVSLALALGLSKMASQKVRVDSLFLDEGFGTLDEEALETALETLAGLQQDGKLIGVISHVQALKERIPTQIVIEPEALGRSKLAGPGCTRY